jgi:hypothetical protein
MPTPIFLKANLQLYAERARRCRECSMMPPLPTARFGGTLGSVSESRKRLILSQAFALRFRAPGFSEVMINHFYGHWNRVSRVVGITFRILSSLRVQSPPYLGPLFESSSRRVEIISDASSLLLPANFQLPIKRTASYSRSSFAGEPRVFFLP